MELPVVDRDSESRPQRMSAASEIRAENALLILVIEDERKLASAIAEGLEGNGYEVALADSGEIGIRQLRNSAFDLILLDVMLPRQGAFKCCARCVAAVTS